MTYLDALAVVLERWRGTPYMEGCCMPGRRGGVDCRYLVVGIHDMLHQITAPLPRRVEPRLYNHDHETAIRVMRDTIERYPCERVDTVEPGDVIICSRLEDVGKELKTPQHILTAGLSPGEVWHAVRLNGVVKGSLKLYETRRMKIYRSMERDKWTQILSS